MTPNQVLLKPGILTSFRTSDLQNVHHLESQLLLPKDRPPRLCRGLRSRSRLSGQEADGCSESIRQIGNVHDREPHNHRPSPANAAEMTGVSRKPLHLVFDPC